MSSMRLHHDALGPALGARSRQRPLWVSKAGDHYLRWLLVAGAMTVIRHERRTNFAKRPWLGDLVARKPTKLAAVALANKNARTAWALLANGGTYRLGGVTSAILAACLGAGAAGVAVMGAVMRADDPASAVAELVTALADASQRHVAKAPTAGR